MFGVLVLIFAQNLGGVIEGRVAPVVTPLGVEIRPCRFVRLEVPTLDIQALDLQAAVLALPQGTAGTAFHKCARRPWLVQSRLNFT